MSNGLVLDSGGDVLSVTITSQANGLPLALFNDRARTVPVANPFTLTGRGVVYVAEQAEALVSVLDQGVEVATPEGAPLLYGFGGGRVSEIEVGKRPIKRSELSSTYVAVFNVKKYGAIGDGVADDTAAIAAAISACRAAGGGVVYLPEGNFKITSQVDITSPTAPAGDTWQGRGLTLRGAGVRATRVTATHAGTALRFYGDKMFSYAHDFELVGPGKATAGSRAIFWDGVAGNTHWRDLYIHRFAVGMEWFDATLHTLVNVAIRDCATAVRTGFNHDIHTFIGCRLDYNDTAIQIGQADATPRDERDMFSHPVRFLGCRISNNTVRAAFISDRYANIHFDACYFESNPKEADIGVSGRVDNGGPTVAYTDCFFTPVTTTPVAVGIDVHNRAHLILQRCETDGASRYTIFVRLNDEQAFYESKHSYVRGGTAQVQYAGRNLNDTATQRETFRLGRAERWQANGAYLPAGAWFTKEMAAGTGETWETWRRITGAGATMGEISAYDRGGVLRVGGTSTTPGYIVATEVTALPTASINHRGALALVTGGVGVADVPYVCRKNAADAYEWLAI